jgi:hypothetical protein
VLLFLTPDRRAGSTVDLESSVPCVDVGYRDLLEAVKETAGTQPEHSDEHRVLMEIAAHLRRNIMRETDDERVYQDIWRKHGKALHGLFLRRPGLEQMKEPFERAVRARFGDDARFTYYPERRGPLREIKLTFASWRAAGFPFNFMLYANPEADRPLLRVLLWSDFYVENRSSLEAWARRVASADAAVRLDPTFSPVTSWTSWRRVLAEDDHPQEAVIDDFSFGAEAVAEAVARIEALVTSLGPHVLRGATPSS